MLKEILRPNSIKQPTAVCLGCFDGLHRGHLEVIKPCVMNKKYGLVPAILTFDRNPKFSLRDSNNYKILMSKSIKLNILEELGIEYFYAPHFDSLKDMQAEQFICYILKDFMKAQKVYCGMDFKFAKNAQADVKVLKKLGEKYNIEVFAIEILQKKGVKISSSKIRQLITEAKIEQANELLGRYFCYDFVVQHGKKLGRKLGTPTINQVFEDLFLVPKYGVYASFVHVDGRECYSVTNISKYIDEYGKERSISETWIPDYHGKELYGKNIRVSLIKRIRDKIIFTDLNSLKNHILSDALISKEIYYNSQI